MSTRRLSAVPLAAALALGLAAAPAAAAQSSAHLTYVGYLGGAPVLSLQANIAVPEGSKPAEGTYVVTADMATTGNLALLYPFTQSLKASGALKGHRPQPASYRSDMRVWNRQESVALTYGANGAVAIQAVPMTRQAQQAQQQGYAKGTMDPASVIVAVASAFAQSGNCAGRYALFDGARRYDLVLEQGGFTDLDPLADSYYAGSATECTATPELVAGFQQTALNANLYPQSAKLWMAPAIAGFPSVPVRIVAESSFGEMTLELTQVSQ
ncbi:MAG TPA: DUF3108 domain-containing protein [Alphaproteobacteria bacterium]|nr:DUF3108 domain-containing protein [Alphaproteobacteria bacterium]